MTDHEPLHSSMTTTIPEWPQPPEQPVNQTDQWAQPQYPPPPYPHGSGGGPGGDGSGGGWGSWGPPPSGAPGPQPKRGRSGVATLVVVAVVAGAIGASAGVAISHRHRVFTPILNTTPPNSSFGQSSGSGGVSSELANAVARKVDPAVVDVTSNLGYQNAVAAGTGMVLTPDGLVLTNNHVINGATRVTVKIDDQSPNYSATVVGTDPTDDVALLQMQGVSGLKTITANSSKLAVGDKVIAIGNGGGRGVGPPTSGAITALGQNITATDEGQANSEALTGLIQTDAPLQRGDSGGPLVNTAGQVIGMNTAASGRTAFGSTVSNQAFAIPITKALSIINQIKAGKASSTIHLGQRPFLGIELPKTPGDTGLPQSTPGAAIAGVANNTPAAGAGLQAGDVITTFDGKTIDSTDSLTSAIQTHQAGDSVTVGWVDQAGQKHSATVKLATGPAD